MKADDSKMRAGGTPADAALAAAPAKIEIIDITTIHQKSRYEGARALERKGTDEQFESTIWHANWK
jgi:hypothetical protein